MGLVGTIIVAVVLLLGLFFGLGLVAFGHDRAKMAYRILTTSTSKTANLDPGYVEVKGRIERPAAGTMTSPFGLVECVAAAWEVEEWDERGDHSYWTTEAEGGQAVPFYVSDGTGEALIDFEGSVAGAARSGFQDDVRFEDDARYDTNGGAATAQEAPVYETSDEQDVRWAIAGEEEVVEVGVKGDEGPPEHIREFVRSHEDVSKQSGSITNVVDIGNAHGDRKYEENRLDVGDEVYVLGHYDPDLDAITVSEEGPMLLSDKSEWKLVGWRATVGVISAIVGVLLLLAVAFFTWMLFL